MKLTVLYFARLREAVGREREQLEVPGEVDTVAKLRAHLSARGAPFAEAFASTGRIRAAVDQTMAQEDTPLRDGAEVAFFPPVTGG